MADRRKYHLAIDIGASSGRHMVGYVENGRIVTEEVYRFENRQTVRRGHECWDLEWLSRQVLAGLRAAADRNLVPETVGIDTWGVDFVLVDELGLPVSDAVSYRDSRTDGMPEAVDGMIPFEDLYARCAVQRVKFNTVYQLVALKREDPAVFEKASRLLMIPDYLNFVLTGKMMNEYTIASTTSLVNAKSKNWDADVIAAVGLPEKIFAPLSMPGTVVGKFTSAVASVVGYQAQVVLPASHDTGSAYLSAPEDEGVCISSGTWSLIGVELSEPLATAEAREFNYTNEGGAWGRYRFLKNIIGLWLVQSIRRELNGEKYVEGKQTGHPDAAGGLSDYRPGMKYSYDELERLAREAPSSGVSFDVTDVRFLNPPSMIREVMLAAAENGGQISTVGELIGSVYLSLAECYAREVENLSRITSKTYRAVNIVGGGSQSAYLNALTSERCGRKVNAGPVEGTVIGNLIVQMVAFGRFKTLAEARGAVVR